MDQKPQAVKLLPSLSTQDGGGGATNHLVHLQQLDFLVLDEADRMVQQGHYQVLRRAPCSDAAGFPLAQRGWFNTMSVLPITIAGD